MSILEMTVRETVSKVKLLEPVDVDKIIVKRDHYFSNAYVTDLPLEATPDHVWQDIFEKQWKTSRHMWDRKLFLMGDKLRLITTAHDFEDKLDWVKQVVGETNNAVDQYNEEAEKTAAETEERVKWEQVARTKTDLETIKDTLRKNFGSKVTQ